MEAEIWKSIPGYDGLYEASSFGRIRSLTAPTRVGRADRVSPKVLRQRDSRRDGRMTVCLYDASATCDTKYVHSLVAETFIGKRPEGMMCCHNDGDETNNASDNLRWATPKSNQQDRVKHGTDVRGLKHPKAKVSDEQVGEILKRLKGGEKGIHLAGEYGVSAALISSFKKGNLRTWLERD